MKSESTLWWIVAADYEVERDGRVRIGPETKRTCLDAIWHLKHNNDYIIISAGKPKGGSYELLYPMKSFLEDNGIDSNRIITSYAKKFCTEGEVEALILTLKDKNDYNFTAIKICVKWWHAIRSFIWLNLYLKKNNFSHSISVLPCESVLPTDYIKWEFFLAIPYNITRMLWYMMFGRKS